MPTIASLTLKATPAGTEEIPVNDAGNDRKVTVGAIQQPAANHIANLSNPHATTKAQVGLGNVDNTNDANKPVSTAQAAALAAQAAALAPKGTLASSGLTLPGTGLAGRQAAGVGAMGLITIGSGLDLTANVLSAPPGLNLVNQRFTEVNTTTTDDDYLVVLQGTTTRTITLKAESPTGKIVAVRNAASTAAVVAIVSGPLGGAVRIHQTASITFFKSTLGWLQISERRPGRHYIFSDGSGSLMVPEDCESGATISNFEMLEMDLPSPELHLPRLVTFTHNKGSSYACQINGHIEGVGDDSLLIFPGESLVLMPTATTWRIVSGPIVPRYSRLTSNVVNNGTANTLINITDLGFAVIPGTFRFRFVIPYTAAVTTTGSRWTVNGPTASMLNYNSSYPLTASTETINRGMTTYLQPSSSNATSLTTGNLAIIEGVATFSAAGTFLPMFANEVTSSAITALAGATGELVRVG